TSDKYELVLENGFDFLNEGFVWEVGSTFTNPQLAETLERIKEEGIDTFYSGSLADEIEEFMIENGGFMRKSDLEMYRAIVREPL
ncbi:MAG TPA: gamma-glutamyltransferase, partial [Mesotoga sp.]|nr:gamma-glutamyltransferase [Mesotoga sp.]